MNHFRFGAERTSRLAIARFTFSRPAASIHDFVEALDQINLMHSFIVVRRGRVIAEGLGHAIACISNRVPAR